jgi:nucleotide-binding universal stress UspA family protein
MTPRRILVPVDFSAGSYAAVEYAKRLAADGDARLHVLHITESTGTTAGWPREHVFGDRRLGAYHRLAALIAGLRLDPFRTTGLVRGGDAAEAIADYAHEMRADLIVMGIHGQQQATPDAPGRVIQRVLGRTDCPVVAVPEPASERVAVYPDAAAVACRTAAMHVA